MRNPYFRGLLAVVALTGLAAADVNTAKQAEARRVEVVAKVRPAVVAVFSANMDGGGSGVVIDSDGYALTNFHVGTSVNPGTSGGPLFNLDAELIGINGRGSFDKRGRVNSGVGYAISINQIKNFLGHLRSGIDTDHATLGATVKTVGEGDEEIARMQVQTILDDSDASRRGLQPEDELVEFAGRPVTSVNQFKNVLGLFPKGWRG